MAAVYGWPTGHFSFPTAILNNTHEHPYQPHSPAYEHVTRFREREPFTEAYQSTAEESHVLRQRSVGRHCDDSQSPVCQFCQHISCQCHIVERAHRPNRRSVCGRCGRRSCRCPADQPRANLRRNRVNNTDQHLLKRRIELFEYHKKEKRYDQAREVYSEAIDCGSRRADSDEMLKLRTSFADMLVAQGSCQEAEDIINEILELDDLPIAVERQCKEIHGTVLYSRKRYNEAEDWYRKLYDRNSKDEWSLKMGDQMCQAITSQGDHDLAQLEHVKLWETKKKSLGKDHQSTVKSAITAVEHLAKLIQKIPMVDGSNKSRIQRRKLAYEAEIEHIFHDIWKSTTKNTQKQEVGMLKAGHELGMSLYNQERQSEAEKILEEVWQGRKVKLGEFDKDTMSSGISLSQAMYMQGPQRCLEAIKILETIREAATTQNHGIDNPIAEAVEAHLAVAYSRNGNHTKAEPLARKSMYKTPTGGVATPSPNTLRLALARALEGQGGYKALEGGELEAELYRSGQLPLSITQSPLADSRMLTERSLLWTGSNPEQLPIAQEAFSNCRGFTNAGPFSSQVGDGRSLLEPQYLKQANVGQEQLWNGSAGEHLERAQQGDQYGRYLIRLGQYAEAKRVLEDALALKRRLYPGKLNNEQCYTASLINSIGHAGQDGDLTTTPTRAALSSSLIRTIPQTVFSDGRCRSKIPTRRKRLGFREVLFS